MYSLLRIFINGKIHFICVKRILISEATFAMDGRAMDYIPKRINESFSCFLRTFYQLFII